MLVIIDTNVVDIVFNPFHSRFSNYKPINKCITDINSRGIMVYGGTKFIKELGTRLDRKYNKLLIELRNIGRLLELERKEVDNLGIKLKRIEPSRNFNDEHIIACVILSGCRLIVTDDKKADKYIKDEKNQFYCSPKIKPKIYRYIKVHERLLRNCFK